MTYIPPNCIVIQHILWSITEVQWPSESPHLKSNRAAFQLLKKNLKPSFTPVTPSDAPENPRCFSKS